MAEYGRLIFFAMLLSGFGPILLVTIFCLLTGRVRWLFTNNPDTVSQHHAPSPLRIILKLYLWMLPVYFVLLCVLVSFGFR